MFSRAVAVVVMWKSATKLKWVPAMHVSFGFPVRSRGFVANAIFTSFEVHCVLPPNSSCRQLLLCAVAVRGSAKRTLPMMMPSRRSPPVHLGEFDLSFISFSLARERHTRAATLLSCGKKLTCACLERAVV